jgi:hypothetical protein
MRYDEIVEKLLEEEGVEESTMMKTLRLRYEGDFIAMMFEREAALIIKVSPQRVDELVADGRGLEFKFTKKRFKEWVLIPLEYEDEYESFIYESLAYAQRKKLPARSR